MHFDFTALTFAQTTFINQLRQGLPSLIHYSTQLLYFFTSFEIALLGFSLALQKHFSWRSFPLKIIKIGLILFILRYYPYLIDTITQSFLKISATILSIEQTNHTLLSPKEIWNTLINISTPLIKMTTSSDNPSLSSTNILLYIASLLTIGLFFLQISIQVIGFYFITTIAVLFLPFGVFSSTSSFCSATIQSVLKAALRIMTLTIMFNLFTQALKSIDFPKLLLNPSVPQNAFLTLELFLLALFFLFLSISLPKLVCKLIGEITTFYITSTPALNSSTNHETIFLNRPITRELTQYYHTNKQNSSHHSFQATSSATLHPPFQPPFNTLNDNLLSSPASHHISPQEPEKKGNDLINTSKINIKSISQNSLKMITGKLSKMKTQQ